MRDVVDRDIALCDIALRYPYRDAIKINYMNASAEKLCGSLTTTL